MARPRLQRRPRGAVVGFFLSLLALLAPELTLAPIAPIQAVEPRPAARARPADEAPLPVAPRVPVAERIDRRTAGGVPPTSTASTRTAEFQAALDAARAKGDAWGVTFAAVKGGELMWAGSSGRARDGVTPLTPETQLVIGSVTKTFVAAAVLQMAEAGALSLDDSVRAHLPELSKVPPEVTVAHLLNHTSGLADLFNRRTQTGIEEKPWEAWGTSRIFRHLQPPWFAPGLSYAYSNTNYYLLGMIIERRTGVSLGDELGRRFTAPLGLAHTRLMAPGDPNEMLGPAWTSLFWGSGTMVSTAADLARWGDALYGDGVLQAETRSAMLDLHEEDYGYGVQKIEVPGADGIGHTGLLNTYTTLLYHLPKDDLTVALLVNRSHVDLAAMLKAKPGDGPSLLELGRAAGR